MKRGEKIVIERTMSGLYKISRDGHPSLIGGAASTAAGLAMMVFQTEASEMPEYVARRVTMPTKVEAWETSDGTTFKDRDEAQGHERGWAMGIIEPLGLEAMDHLITNQKEGLRLRLALSVISEWIKEVDRPPTKDEWAADLERRGFDADEHSRWNTAPSFEDRGSNKVV